MSAEAAVSTALPSTNPAFLPPLKKTLNLCHKESTACKQGHLLQKLVPEMTLRIWL